MFGGGIFGSQNQSSMDQMRQQLEMQMSQYNKMQQAQQAQQGASGLVEEFKNTLSQLSQDEQHYLSKIPEFVQAKSIYEQGFLEFLGTKFSGEYISTPIGKQAIENLTDSAKMAVKQIKDASKERTQKLEAMAALLESDPDIQKKLQEQLNKQ